MALRHVGLVAVDLGGLDCAIGLRTVGVDRASVVDRGTFFEPGISTYYDNELLMEVGAQLKRSAIRVERGRMERIRSFAVYIRVQLL